MKLRKGCGCPILILLVADVVMLVGAVISMIRGPGTSTIQATRTGEALVLVLALGNVVSCALLALVALRGERSVGPDVQTSFEAVEGEAAEGADAEGPDEKEEDVD